MPPRQSCSWCSRPSTRGRVQGITCFLVEPGTPGFKVGQQGRQTRHSRVLHRELILDHCRVPRRRCRRIRATATRSRSKRWMKARIGIGGADAGPGRRAPWTGRRYARERQQFGKAIGEFQGVQFELAEMASDIEAARLLVYNAARFRDAGWPFVRKRRWPSISHLTSPRPLRRRAVEILGGVGLLKIIQSRKLFQGC